ncbi:hypothetical protein [uncultured Gammaproteobacteria bacterium]|nr:hypothetical protein [uncultured Gammaproteobacteria bacterium]
MRKKGEYHDNAVAECFFNTLKIELINQQTYQTRREVSSASLNTLKCFITRLGDIQRLIITHPMVMKRGFIVTTPLNLILSL